jgi:hypothetical protein
MRGGARQPVYVKNDGYDGARREVLYHNLAHQFFGLGKYVPTTALVKHPHTGDLMSVQEGIPDAKHNDVDWDEDAPLHEDGAVTFLRDASRRRTSSPPAVRATWTSSA